MGDEPGGPPHLRAALVCSVALGLACAAGESPPGATARDGQWVWSVADSALFAAAGPAATPGVWVATIRPSPAGDSLQQSLALPPTVGGGAPIAAVIRFDAALHSWWGEQSDATTARLLDQRISALLALLDRSGVAVAEVQLDYDCPVRLLSRWSRVLHRLRRSSLAGREVWVTSLVAHQRDPRFGARLRGAADGQIVQLFDTGDRATDAQLAELERLVPRQRLPFRIGLGAFERRLPSGRTTDHTVWFGAVRRFRTWPGYRGLWVFPAGQPWRRRLGAA